MKKVLCSVGVLVSVILIIAVGVYWGMQKKELVAFRIGVEEKYVDHDLNMALNVLKNKFEKAGYKVGKFTFRMFIMFIDLIILLNKNLISMIII